jgi:tape measure domain-containing protein
VSVVANVAINVDSSGAVSKLRQVQQGAQATSQAVDKLNATAAATENKFRGAGSSASALAASLGKLAAAYLTLQTAQRAVQAGIQREESGRRLTFLAQGYNEVAQAQQAAARAGKQFGLSTTESNQQFAQLYGRLRPLNTSLTDIEAAFIGFNTAAKVSGTTAAESAGALLQLTQALGSGVLRGQELNSVLEQAPGLVVALTQELGAPISQIRKLAEDGKITSDVVIRALKRAGIEGAGQLAEAMKGPAQQVKNLQNAFQDFQVAITRDVLPAFIEIIKGATELLRLFGQLPGPMKTIIAAAIGLTAAFVALAPAISAAIGLLGGLSIATLAAAGPWVALAAGVTAAAVALAGYRSESEKIGAKAAAGDPAAIATARNRMVNKQQEISLLERQRPGPRSSRGGDLANARRELAQLKRDVAIGTTAPTTVRPNAMGTPIDATVGGGGGGGRAAGGADDAKRAADEALRESQRVADVVRDQQFITKQKGIQTKFAQLIFDAELAADPIRVRQLQTVEALVLAGNETARLLEEEKDSVAQLAIARTRQGEAESIRQEGLQDVLKLQVEQQKNFDAIISSLDLELALKTATTEQAREQLRLANELAGLQGQGFTPEQIGAITAKKTELAAPLTDAQNISATIGKLQDEITQLTSISNIAITSAEGIGNAFSQAFQGLISGSMSAKEALSGFFKSVGDMFISMATEIIAKQLVMITLQAILKSLGGGSSLGFGGNSDPLGAGGGFWAGRANGGPVAGGMPYLVGERGPELFVPSNNGGVMSNNDMRAAMGSRPGGANGSPVLNMSFQSTNINGVEYVSRDQLEAAMAQTRRQAAKEGANRGMNMTLDKIQNSPSTRSRVGIR